VELICPTAQAKYFSRGDWTTQITLNRLAKFDFARIRFCKPKAGGAKGYSRKWIT
jgi:hypothetical protein